jgi:hypothetical protein
MRVFRAVKSFAKLVIVGASLSSRLASAGHGVYRLVSAVPTPSLPSDHRTHLIHGGGSAQVRTQLREGRPQARRARTLRARLTGITAGHGVHHSLSRSPVEAACGCPPSPTTPPSTKAPHQNDPRALAERRRTNQSNGGVSAGHGVHRSNSRVTSGHPPACGRLSFIPAHLCSSVSPLHRLSAGHGVHRSILETRPPEGACPA